MRYVAVLLAFGLCAWLPVEVQGDRPTGTAKKINLALRRTADRLLRISGDNSSRIPSIDQVSANTWRVYTAESIAYDSLPQLLQASLDRYEIAQEYEVTIVRCDDHTIDLGYHKQDFVQDSLVPCSNREEPTGCHYIEVTFSGIDPVMPGKTNQSWILMLAIAVSGGGVAAYWWKRKKGSPGSIGHPVADTGWLTFGNTKLHLGHQLLEIDGSKHSLTYREAKLLHLFATHAGEILERNHILQHVWADEGIQVGRSLDMFVSRLRKKLKDDQSVGLVAIHGLGYKLEVR